MNLPVPPPDVPPDAPSPLPSGPPTEAAEILRDTPPHGIPETEDHLDRKLALMADRSRAYLGVALVVQAVLILLLIGGVVYLIVANNGASARNSEQIAVNQRLADQRWCAAFDLLTSVPVAKPSNPASNPSREGQYKLYVDFVTLKEEFHCS